MKADANDLPAKLKVLRGNLYFDDLPETLLKQVAGQMRLKEFARGETLFWEGDPCSGLHILEQGSVRLYSVSPQGRQYTLRVMQEGETCNEVPAFDGGTNPVNGEALEDGRVWVIDAAMLRALVQTHPQFALKVLSNFAGNLRSLVRKVSEMAFYQVTHRLARLIDETQGDRREGPQWTQEQLAAQLGTVREVVARSLKELERSGAIRVEERRIRITDPEALEQWTRPYS